MVWNCLACLSGRQEVRMYVSLYIIWNHYWFLLFQAFLPSLEYDPHGTCSNIIVHNISLQCWDQNPGCCSWQASSLPRTRTSSLMYIKKSVNQCSLEAVHDVLIDSLSLLHKVPVLQACVVSSGACMLVTPARPLQFTFLCSGEDSWLFFK